MKVTVLGGAAAGGNTGSGCSGYLIQSNDTNLVVDLGPGTLPELRKHCDFRSINAIVITHWHVDHYLDLAAFRFAAAYNPHPIDHKVLLFMPPDTTDLLRRFGSALPQDERDFAFFDDIFLIREFDPGTLLNVFSFECEFHPTRHFIPCWAIRITDDSGMRLGYSADTGPGVGLEAFFDGVDTLIAESTDLHRDPDAGEPGHLTAVEAGTLARNCGVQTLILTHMWEEHGFDNYLEQARLSFAGETMLAHPGLQVSLGETAG
jgi:ribonuclease BN (tRNA processing enzyme)